MVALLIFGWIFFGLADALAFDKLIRLEHSRYRTNWEGVLFLEYLI